MVRIRKTKLFSSHFDVLLGSGCSGLIYFFLSFHRNHSFFNLVSDATKTHFFPFQMCAVHFNFVCHCSRRHLSSHNFVKDAPFDGKRSRKHRLREINGISMIEFEFSRLRTMFESKKIKRFFKVNLVRATSDLYSIQMTFPTAEISVNSRHCLKQSWSQADMNHELRMKLGVEINTADKFELSERDKLWIQIMHRWYQNRNPFSVLSVNVALIQYIVW